MTTVFISYVREDQVTAKRIYADLKERGICPWMDLEDLLPGERWRAKIMDTIKTSSHFLALVSSRSVDKRGFVQRELKEALELLGDFPESAIFVIPVRLDRCEPSHKQLEDLHWVDLFPDYDDGLRRIVMAINGAQRERLRNSGRATSSKGVGLTIPAVPRDFSDLPEHVTAPLRDGDSIWEHRLFLSMLKYEMHLARDLKASLEYGLPTAEFQRLDFFEYISWNLGQTRISLKKGTALGKLINVGFERAMGRLGQPGDPVEIHLVTKKIGEIYRWAIEWGVEFNSVIVGEEVEYLLSLHEQIPYVFIDAIEQFCSELSEEVDRYFACPPQERSSLAPGKIEIEIEYPNTDEISRETHRLLAVFQDE